MSKKFAAFDIDGTLFRWQLFHELVFELRKRGLLAEGAEKLNEAFARWRALESTWEDYENAVVKAIHTDIKNIDPLNLEAAAQAVVDKSGHKVHAYTSKLAKKLKADGYTLIAISGSQQEIAEIFAKRHGFDYCVAALHERDSNGKYTGKYSRFIVGYKAEILNDLVKELDLTFKDSYAVGDSSGDISMLQLVENPIAFNPDESLIEAATKNGWNIVIERKNIAYTLKKEDHGYSLAKTDAF